MKRSALLLALLTGGASPTLAGCGKSPPRIVPVQGRVLINGRPLPRAAIQFVPELKGFGAEVNSEAVSDDEGKFTLTCAWKNKPGAVVGTHRVLVSDTRPEPEKGEDGREGRELSQAALARYLGALKERPIPPRYGTFYDTPLRVTVDAGTTSYEVKLERP